MDTPMTPESLAARNAEIKSRLAELNEEYQGQAFPEGARAEWDDLHEERAENERLAAELEARREQLEELAQDESRTESIADTRFHTRRPNAMRNEDIYDLTEYRRRAADPESERDLMVDGAKRAVEQIATDNADLSKAERLLTGTTNRDPGTVARHYLRYGSPAYSRAFAKTLMGKALTQEESRAFTVGSTGTYPVPIALDPTITHTSNWSINPWRQISNVETITGTTWKGVTSGAITANRRSEAAAATDNTPTLTQPSITPTRVDAFVPLSYETEQDWGSVYNELASLFAEAKDDEEATAFATGNGSGANPQGILSSSAAVTTVTTASSGAFVIGDIYKLLEQLPTRFRANATWVSSLYGINKVRQFDTAGGAGLVVRLPQGASGQPGSQQASSGVELLGRPLYESTAINTSNVLTTGTNIFLIGDFRYYKIVERLGMEVRHVPDIFDTSTGYPTGQSGVFAFWRNSGKVLSASAFRILQT